MEQYPWQASSWSPPEFCFWCKGVTHHNAGFAYACGWVIEIQKQPIASFYAILRSSKVAQYCCCIIFVSIVLWMANIWTIFDMLDLDLGARLHQSSLLMKRMVIMTYLTGLLWEQSKDYQIPLGMKKMATSNLRIQLCWWSEMHFLTHICFDESVWNNLSEICLLSEIILSIKMQKLSLV